MGSPSSSRLRSAAVVHKQQDSQRVERAHYLDARCRLMNGRAVPLRKTPESVGKIVTLSSGRLGALSPRDERGRRRPLRACDSEAEAQQILADWRAARETIYRFLLWLVCLGIDDTHVSNESAAYQVDCGDGE